jgi:uncharacterized membrane protein YagU involved in acid resistance
MRRRKQRIGKAALAGLAGGLVASWMMNQFQAGFSKLSQKISEDGQNNQEQSGQYEEEVEDATMKTANNISRAVLHKELSKDEKKKMGSVVHYVFGGAMGTLYGIAAARYPHITRGFGTGFATALFAVGDELAVPLFGLSKGPTEVPLSSHASAFLAHLTYGITAESMRRFSLAVL